MSEPAAKTPERAPEDEVLTRSLGPLREAMVRGDHAEARRVGTELLGHEDERVRAEAERTLARLRPDRVIVGVFLFTGFLALLLAALYLHGP